MIASQPEVRSLSTRVALTATALVAAVYFIIALAVAAYVTGSLVAQVDERLARTLAAMAQGRQPFVEPMVLPAERPLGPELAAWVIGPDGSVVEGPPGLELPAEYRSVTAPTTLVIDGTGARVAGTRVGAIHVVVAESLDPVTDARNTIILGELLVAPILLVTVFVGAITIGRRVATPIELARQRQMDFTADASHELRTPLAVIEANASLALARDREGSWYRAAFEQVDAEAKRMRRLLDDLLWLARLDTTRQTPRREPVDLSVLAQQAADRFTPVAEAKGIALRVDAEQEGAVVAAPAEWADRLLGVLIDNACKYAPAGGSVTVAVMIKAGNVVLTVDDTGPGIPERERARIFDRFHRATDRAGGAGLGLAIADAIVRATGGQWTLATSPGGGARLRVTWRRAGVWGHEVAGSVAGDARPPTSG